MDPYGMIQEEAKIVVGLDFGTTFSGFSFLHRSCPEKIYTFYEWPSLDKVLADSYCKTLTSLWYVRNMDSGLEEVKDWGASALVNYTEELKRSSSSTGCGRALASGSEMNSLQSTGEYHCNFKLHLARLSKISCPEVLPDRRLDTKKLIADYLREMSILILKELQNKFGPHIEKEDIQWCITVPAIWEEDAKRAMTDCSEMAGLVHGILCNDRSCSPHPLKVALEPEAASIYCLMNVKDHKLSKGDKFMVVDIGGGTVDLVIHQKTGLGSSLKVKEVTCSTGLVCGGTFVDNDFWEFLENEVGCLTEVAGSDSFIKLDIKKQWDSLKRSFDELSMFDLDIPSKLAEAWEDYDSRLGIPARSSYDAIELSYDDLQKFFYPTVHKVLGLMEESFIEGLEVIMVVGGFSASPYMMKRIREKFGRRVRAIIRPPNPGSAICCGAAVLGLGEEMIMSRIAKKTYGVKVVRRFQRGDCPDYMTEDENGDAYCCNVFGVFVRKGEEVPVNYVIKQIMSPFLGNQTRVEIELYSSNEVEPRYITDDAAELEGKFMISINSQSSLGTTPKIAVSMFFGRSHIQVAAKRLNCGDIEELSMLPVRFSRDLV
ncbi:hypothetical protein O6H91_Y179200 [Diphasiastrum complanatum]|nr:hypothetical protein O6H91_Y523400 [Diphasiastrum complanatum]KAJ7292398.1 hypothetical protein O6H91_Y280100 [Diphasiastrum complanatum]KAJ7299685.1 hypothetical protein O6H91_Y179200 [Diphasiastrum complanatum]